MNDIVESSRADLPSLCRRPMTVWLRFFPPSRSASYKNAGESISPPTTCMHVQKKHG